MKYFSISCILVAVLAQLNAFRAVRSLRGVSGQAEVQLCGTPEASRSFR